MARLSQVLWEKDGIIVDTFLPGLTSKPNLRNFLNAIAPYRTSTIRFAWHSHDGYVRYNRALSGVHKEIVWLESANPLYPEEFLPCSSEPGFPAIYLAVFQIIAASKWSKNGVRYVTIPAPILTIENYTTDIMTLIKIAFNDNTLQFKNLRFLAIRGGL